VNIVGHDEITCRPSLQTLARRLMLSLRPLMLLAVLFWQCGLPWQEPAQQRQMPAETVASLRELEREQTKQLQELLPPEKWRQFEETRREKQLQRQADLTQGQERQNRIRMLGAAAYWTATCGLIAIAVVPLLLIPVHRVAVARGPGNELVVRQRGLWPTRRSIPLQNIDRILVGPEEDVTRIRALRIRNGWRWLVCLVGREQPDPSTGIADELDVQFFIDFQRQRPDDPSRPPRRVQTFAESLSRITSVSDIAYAIPGEPFGRPEQYGWPVQRKSVVVSSEPAIEKHSFRSLADVPEHLRGDVERLMDESRRTGRREIREFRVTIRDSNGNEVTYNALDEMPPDVRARYERALRKSRRGPDDD